LLILLCSNSRNQYKNCWRSPGKSQKRSLRLHPK